MNPAIKAEWVKALTSGEYQQGETHLKAHGRHCCLGVLCELHAKATGDEWTKVKHGVYAYEGASSYPTLKVLNWAGLAEGGSFELIESLRINGELKSLDIHNDSGRTFAEIAAAIQEQL